MVEKFNNDNIKDKVRTGLNWENKMSSEYITDILEFQNRQFGWF